MRMGEIIIIVVFIDDIGISGVELLGEVSEESRFVEVEDFEIVLEPEVLDKGSEGFINTIFVEIGTVQDNLNPDKSIFDVDDPSLFGLLSRITQVGG